MDPDSGHRIRVRLSDGSVILVEGSAPAGERDVGIFYHSFESALKVVQTLATDLKGALLNARPQKTTLEFGIELAVESEGLTAILVKGSGTANLKVTLEWNGQ